jgi:hypothetical protein
MKITALGYDWLKVDKGISKYIKVDKRGEDPPTKKLTHSTPEP